jgi:uncharacterized protein YicC (UPF0701 family)
MKHLKNYLLIPILLGAIFSVSAAAQDKEVRVTASAVQDGTPKGVTLTDRLIDALERENAALKTRLDTERSANAILIELNETRKSEGEALRQTIAAKNETIAAKESVITAQDKLIATLKTKRTSIWKRIGDIAIGAAVGAVMR